jgi:hypothetical protein
MQKSELLNVLKRHFSSSDLQDICLQLGVEYEDLAGASRADKARELILYLDHRERVAELVAVCQRLRPNVFNPSLSGEPTSAEIPEHAEANKAIRILFLTANPRDTSSLRLDEEIRAVDLALHQAEFRDRFDIRQQWAVRVTDLQGYFLRHKPDIVHFSGHGSPSSQIILEDVNGNSQPVSPRALSQVFSILKDNIRCVVRNACYSEQQAQAIAQHIDCVIGMSKAIGDAAAISFATAFYQALGYGRTVKTAFDLGCAQIDLENLDEQDTPKLLAINSNPANIAFVNDEVPMLNPARGI